MRAYVSEPLDNGALNQFYDRLFPMDDMIRWLTHEDNNDNDKQAAILRKRELSVTLCVMGEDEYHRWLGFRNQGAFERKLLTAPYPHKIDIGARYSLPIAQRKAMSYKFRPTEKEVVFDLDMNDYDDMRTCCTGKVICMKCWRFMTLAVRLMDNTLRADFAFEHILWVFSGRRGIHAWICDEKAMKMNNTERISLVSYLNLVNERARDGRPVKLKSNVDQNILQHPVYARAVQFCREEWKFFLEEQNFYAATNCKETDHRKVLRDMLPEVLKIELDELFKKMDKVSNDAGEYSTALWKQLCIIAEKKNFSFALDEAMVAYTYPRLDVNVTKDIGHLLKSPFVAHPATSRVCVPIDPKNIYAGADMNKGFDPFKVPTVPTLLREPHGTHGLKEYLEYFKEFNDKLVLSNDEE